MIWLLALMAAADPIAQRSPVEGDAVVVVGAPSQGVAWRKDLEDGPRITVSAAVRLPAAASDVSVGLSTHRGPEVGWGWAAGGSAGVAILREPSLGISLAPYARLERRGTVHGGAQLVVPVVIHPRLGARFPVLGETFVGLRRGRVHAVAAGGLGWTWMTGTPAGSLLASGSIHLGWALSKRDGS